MAADARVPAGSRELDRLFRQGTLLGRTEAELLDHFVRSRDEYAFEALVTRHGPMVLRTCRALLPDLHDADDAFQATFLVLSRRAGSIRNAELLGPWLHRVARRVATRSLARSSRRSRLERPLTDALAAPSTLPHPDRAAIHEAIDRLPEAYRRVIILCDLEGHSHAEAASRLACPIGTVKGRQSRARSLLRRRLTRLGLAPASLVSGSLFTLPARAFSVPHTLIHRTSRTAATFALGGTLAPGTVPGGALSLATGVLTGMAAHQLKLTALIGLLALGLGSSGLAALRYAENGDGVPGGVATTEQRPEGHPPDGPGLPSGAAAEPVPAPDEPRDPDQVEKALARLLGEWRHNSSGRGRMPLDLRMTLRPADPELADLVEPGTIPFIAETRKAPWAATASSVPIEYLVAVDPTADPPQLDFIGGVPVVRELLGKASKPVPGARGIYRFVDGALVIVSALRQPGMHDAELERPSSFRIRVDSNLTDDSFTRIEPAREEGIAPLLGTWEVISIEGKPYDGSGPTTLDIQRVPRLGQIAGVPGRPVLCTERRYNREGQVIGRTQHYAVVNHESAPPRIDGLTMTLELGTGGNYTDRPAVYWLEGDTLTIHNGDVKPPYFEVDESPVTRLTVYRRVLPDDGTETPPPPASEPDSPSDGGEPGAVPPPPEDAEGNRPEDPGRDGTDHLDDSPDEPRPSPFDRPLGAGGPRRSSLVELDREQRLLRDEIADDRPEAELLTIEAEVIGELYRERFEDYERMKHDLAQRPGHRDQMSLLEIALDEIRQQYLDRMSQAAYRQTYLRSIESALEATQRQIEAMRFPVDDHPTMPVETIEHRLSTLEAKLDRLLELLESPDR